MHHSLDFSLSLSLYTQNCIFYGFRCRSSMKMTKSTSKWTCTKAQLIFGLSSLIGAAIIADYVWASSSSFSSIYFSVSSNLAAERSRIIVASTYRNTTEQTGNNRDQKSVTKRIIPATYYDIPAPELEWEQMASAPVPRLDGYSVQIKNLLYVFAGYGTIDYVHSHVDVYNMTDNNWCDRINMPKEMAHSHLGIATDGRYVYVITGQYGPQCRGPISSSFVLDTKTKTWKSFPSLPAPRYAPATQIWRGRLHVMGGSKENRHTPGTEHWSIAVKNGKSLENKWRVEIPIPRGGPHRASIVVDDGLYVIGGQEGDFMAKPGSPIFKCSRRNEVVYGDVYMLDSSMKWHVLPSMPKPDSHIECSWVVVNNAIIIVGGTTEKHPVTKRMILVGEVFKFDITSQKWSVMGRLPYRVKTAQAGFWNGYLYFTSGQRDRWLENPQPGKVIGEMWRTKLIL